MEVQRHIIEQRVQNSTQEEETLPGGGGGYSTNVDTGRLHPEVQTLTLLYTIFQPFRIHSFDK